VERIVPQSDKDRHYFRKPDLLSQVVLFFTAPIPEPRPDILRDFPQLNRTPIVQDVRIG
jgi:hypothetical protein